MRNKWMKLISLILCMLIAAGAFAAAELTAYGDEIPFSLSGFCGAEDEEDVEWYAFNDLSMVFFGSGAIRNYTDNKGSHPAPWYGEDYSTIATTLFINKIAVEYGITAIGDYCFYVADNYLYKYFIQLKNIDIADTVTYIGRYAFYNQLMEEVMLPPSVKHIGENAFKKCNNLKKISYFGNPDTLRWDSDGNTDTEFLGKTIVCHILSTYSQADVNRFNQRFAYKHITFVADMDNPYEGSGDELSRNIALYYGAANSSIFGGAAPYIIVGSFNGMKKSVTHGSNGFASCVMRGGKYYILTDNTTGKLNEANVNSLTGKIENYDSTPLSDLKLSIRHEYIGLNTVKVIYRLKNTGSSEMTDLKVGGTGDIKIGADDFASIEPLNEGGSQVGFYMKSNQPYDQNGDDYATLGFIGKGVQYDPTEENGETYPNANFFYGVVDTAQSSSGAGAKTVILIPQRIFEMNSTYSQDHDTFEGVKDGVNRDSGMSYYWDNITLARNEYKEFAILFSVYGTSDEESAHAVIDDLKETYYSVTWQNYDGTDLLKTTVKKGDTPVYTGPAPYRPSTAEKEYNFNNTWSPALGAVNEDTVYTAQFDEIDRYFFISHSLSLDGDIGINYYVDVTAVPDMTKADIISGTKKIKLKFHWYDKESEYIIDRDHAETLTTGGKECFRAKCSVNAAEMTYDVHATAYYSNDGGTTWTEYTREQDIYSVREYAKVILDTESAFSTGYAAQHGQAEYEKLRELMIRMLDYGAKAQLAFDRRTNDLANNIFLNYGVTYTMTYMTAGDIGENIAQKSNMKENIGDVGLKYAGSSVLFLSKNSIRHYYTVEDDTLFTQEVIGADHNGFTYHTKDPGIYFEYSGIPASRLDEQTVFSIGGHEYGFSVLNYCQLVLDSKVPREDKNLAIATYWYNDAANEYFGD